MEMNQKVIKLFHCIVAIIISITLFSEQVNAKTLYQDISNDSEWSVLKLVNKERLKKGNYPISMFDTIQKASDIRAKELIKKFDHTRPNSQSCFSVLEEKNIKYNVAGENIAAGQSNAKDVMKAWMNSAGHKANILNDSYQHIGIGYEKGGTYKNNWVQMFIGGCNIESIKINSKDTVKNYKKNTKIDNMKRYLVIKCSNHGTSYAPVIEEMCKGYKKTKTGKQTIYVNFQEKETKFTVNITK